MDSRRFKTMEEFILNYRAAEQNDLPIEKFANILGLKPASVERRKLSVKHGLGLELPDLPRMHEGSLKGRDSESVTDDEYNEFVKTKRKFIEIQEKFQLHESKSKKKVYVITAAQNATPVHAGFFASLLTYAQHNDAELMVIPLRYRNPTSIWSTKSREADYWATSVLPYIVNKPTKLNENMMVAGQMKIQPTAVSPLSGLDAFTGESSGIFGHTSVQLVTVPTPAKKYPKLLATTGAVTIPNYTDTKTGFKGEFNHSLSACIIEIDGDEFHQRHVSAMDDTGHFYDCDKYYTPKGVHKSERIAALVTGDIHAEFHDPDVEKATYTAPDSIMNVLRPEVWVIHDLTDFYARNHHHRGNDLLQFAKHHYGRNNVEEGLQVCADFVDAHSRPDMLNMVVRSNHDEALDRWLREAEPKSDPENAIFYHYMKMHQYKNVRRHATGFESFDALEFWCNNPEAERGLRNTENTKFLKRDESFVVNGTELSFHGDQGSNGGRGSIRSFAKVGPKTIIGHGHSPGIYQGAYQVGVSARKDLEYASGCSSWMHTHGIIYPDGHRTLVHIVNGKWRVS